MAWSWLTLSPRPLRVAVDLGDARFAVYLTVLPAGKGSPPSHRPMYGCHMLSRVLSGEVEQVMIMIFISVFVCGCFLMRVVPDRIADHPGFSSSNSVRCDGSYKLACSRLVYMLFISSDNSDLCQQVCVLVEKYFEVTPKKA